jgi:hypothetical protein
MNIVEALKKGCRIITRGSKWLVCCQDTGRYVIYSKPLYARKTVTLIITDSLEEALDVLIEE